MTPSNLEILAYEETPLGPLCLRRRELLSSPGTVVTEITLDHDFLMSSRYTDSEEALARIALEMHDGSDLTVLVGGLGLGYTARAALASSRVVEVEAVELLPQVTDWMERGLVPLSEELLADERFVAIHGDVFARLEAPPSERPDPLHGHNDERPNRHPDRHPNRRHDLILIDVDHAPDDRLGESRDSSDTIPSPDTSASFDTSASLDTSDSFYTEDGLRRASRHLAPGGVLGVWSYAESSDFSRALRRVFDRVRVEPVTYHNHLVDEERTDWLFFARSP